MKRATITEEQREKFFQEAEAAYLALQSDEEARQEELAERAEWDATLVDDLEKEDWEAVKPVPKPRAECTSV